MVAGGVMVSAALLGSAAAMLYFRRQKRIHRTDIEDSMPQSASKFNPLYQQKESIGNPLYISASESLDAIRFV
jgi:hypothetical protein